MKAMCATCPFRPGSPYAYLAPELAACACTAVSRICHSTGRDNAINRRTGKPERLCRGARNVQLNYLFAIKFLEQPTDEAWDKKCKQLNIS